MRLKEALEGNPEKNAAEMLDSPWLMNSWLAHGFTRHGADQPFRFIHFNVGVEEHSHMNCCAPLPPEVI